MAPSALSRLFLYSRADRFSRGNAPVQNLAHGASLHSVEKIAQSKHGIEHLDVKVQWVISGVHPDWV